MTLLSTFFAKPTFVVQPIGAERAEDCERLHGASFAFGWSKFDFESYLTDAHIIADGAISEGKKAEMGGFILSRLTPPDAEILTFAVDPARRGMGLGRMLIEKHLDNLERGGARLVFLEVADAVDLPLGIYNNPPRVKSDLHWDQLLRIFKHPNYVVHKESTTRVGQVAQIIAGRPDVSIMCCDSPNLGLVLPTMSLGGHGTANMTGNIAPAEIATISTPWKSYADAEAFKETYLRILPLWHYVYSHINPVALKSLMKAVGLPAGDLRRPLKNLEGEALAKGVNIVRELGLDQRYGFRLGPGLARAA